MSTDCDSFLKQCKGFRSVGPTIDNNRTLIIWLTLWFSCMYFQRMGVVRSETTIGFHSRDTLVSADKYIYRPKWRWIGTGLKPTGNATLKKLVWYAHIFSSNKLGGSVHDSLHFMPPPWGDHTINYGSSKGVYSCTTSLHDSSVRQHLNYPNSLSFIKGTRVTWCICGIKIQVGSMIIPMLRMVAEVVILECPL